MNYFVLMLLFCMQHVCISNGYYYWKDYHNIVPLEAFEAGQDINKEKVYIGQVFIKTEGYPGIYPTSILRGKDSYAPLFGAKKADNFIQILCSNDPENLEWIAANSTHLHLLKSDNEMIRGGIENDSWLNIGRLNYQGGTAVGKILSGSIGSAEMWFVYNGNEVRAESYELLTYNDIASKISVRTSQP